jgi:hypothetical protein
VLRGTLGVDEHTSALNHDVDIEGAPRKLCRVAVGHNHNLIAVDRDGVVIHNLQGGRMSLINRLVGASGKEVHEEHMSVQEKSQAPLSLKHIPGRRP